MRMRALAVIAASVVAAVAAGAQQVGEITYLDGSVEITRDEMVLGELELDAGSGVENLDRIRTADNGDLYFALTDPSAAGAEIHVSSGSTFYVELEQVDSGRATTFGLITGSLAFKVQKLSGSRSLQVRTETATMGVRGTTFAVQTAPTGDVLVTCNEGRVVCTDEDSGQEIVAEPGQVVEKRADELFRSVPVAVSDLRQFREDWLAERIEVFKPNALRVTRFYASRYDELLEEFSAAYGELMSHREILTRWVQEDQAGSTGTRIQAMRDKKAIVGSLFRLRKNLFIFERIYFRLVELESYHQQGYGRGELTPGVTAAAFWQRFDTDQRDLAAKMAKIRYSVKLYAKRNDGAFPLSF